MMGVATLFRGITESFRGKLNLDEILIYEIKFIGMYIVFNWWGV